MGRLLDVIIAIFLVLMLMPVSNQFLNIYNLTDGVIAHLPLITPFERAFWKLFPVITSFGLLVLIVIDFFKPRNNPR